MTRRAWTWGVGLLVVGGAVLAAALHAMLTYRPGAGSEQATTLGQVVSTLIGALMLLAAAAVLGVGLRRHLQLRRVRRLRDRLASRVD